MKMRQSWKFPWIALALGVMALPVCAQPQGASQQTGDPVADAARKAREDKKNAKPKKVFTDDDVKPAASQPAPAAGGPAAANPAQKPGDADQKDDPNGEKAWRKKFAEQHSKIDKAQQELDVLQRELDKAQVQYYNDPQKALAEQNNRADINDKTAKIDAKKKEIAQLQQELDDLESELRKSGGDPGWAR